ncbi:hypothetical protein L228DRAFT_32914 [Xylona heveae TC161]|uniref:GET complex, subunit GET2 n=1 Tax=Xylona heveae (strain CBS 132557 / TC161) TaxID=1328760 RepID=A0A165A5G3_XYLHT|nr:hypothetical protein L228DRAFT_32914 [Xylona heveae TC161]KZF19977.1 hypothetical protein L228DRAFT_32914 [Xylona heveae TC161]
MESPTATSNSPSPSPGTLTPQEQAKLRRERRQAKIQAGGAARLNKITSLSGRPQEPALSTATNPESSPLAPATPTTAPDKPADDPEEVDISQHYYVPHQESRPDSPQSQTVQQDLFRQMLSGIGPDSSGQQIPSLQSNTSPGSRSEMQGSQAEAEDPMMRMLQQLMGGDSNGSDAKEALPPGLASIFGGQQEQQPEPNKYGNIWRIVHALFALALGVYIVAATPFSGSHFSRSESLGGEVGVQFFWIFATAELILQSSRFFLERGRLPTTGILGGLGSMLPEPYAGYVRVLNRYSVIYTTIVTDAMVIVFVLGSVAWWKGLVN